MRDRVTRGYAGGISLYTLRGDVENRFKDLKAPLRADRISCHRFTANAFRLLLHAAACVLMHTLRSLLGGTELGDRKAPPSPSCRTDRGLMNYSGWGYPH